MVPGLDLDPSICKAFPSHQVLPGFSALIQYSSWALPHESASCLRKTSSFSLSFSLQFIFTSSGHLQYFFLLVDLGRLKIVYRNILGFIVSFLACILDPGDCNPVYLLIGRMIFHHSFLCSIPVPLFPDSDHNGLETIDFITLGCIPMGCCFSLLLLLLGQVNLYFFLI